MNIIFDLGEVVVTWRPKEIIAMVFPDPAVQETVHTRIIQHADWLDLDRGTLSREDAIARATDRTGLPETQIAHLFRLVPLALVAIPGTIDLLYRLKNRAHSLYCLSNIQKASIEHLESEYSFWEVFSGRVISSRIGLVKPEPEIFFYLLQTYQLKIEATILVDDLDVNLAVAERIGIRTVKFESPVQCEIQLRALQCV